MLFLLLKVYTTEYDQSF